MNEISKLYVVTVNIANENIYQDSLGKVESVAFHELI